MYKVGNVHLLWKSSIIPPLPPPSVIPFSFNQLRQLQNHSLQCRILRCIRNIKIDHMHWFISTISFPQIFTDNVEASFFARENYIKGSWSFGTFAAHSSVLVTLQHRQETILSVKIRVFRLQIVVNVLVALAEGISIRAVSSWAWHLYLTIRSERANFKALLLKMITE